MRLTGTPVEFFCYPSGKYDAAAIAEVKRAGFLGATTVDPGLASRRELWTLKRVRVDERDTAETLRRKLLAAR